MNFLVEMRKESSWNVRNHVCAGRIQKILFWCHENIAGLPFCTTVLNGHKPILCPEYSPNVICEESRNVVSASNLDTHFYLLRVAIGSLLGLGLQCPWLVGR